MNGKSEHVKYTSCTKADLNTGKHSRTLCAVQTKKSSWTATLQQRFHHDEQDENMSLGLRRLPPLQSDAIP